MEKLGYRSSPLSRHEASVKGVTVAKASVEKSVLKETVPASALIDARVRELADWRGTMLAQLRGLIHEADPEVTEEWKWRGVPVWSHGGILCTGESYKSVVKLTFAKGAALPDPAGLFNSSLDGNVRRAIDVREGEKLNEAAFKELVRAAVALNLGAQKAKGKAQGAAKKKS